MIIWISGAYGIGKSTLAEAMAAQMKNALIFDAKEVGNAVRENYPNCPYGYIFEDYPLWSDFCYLLLKDIHLKFQKDILVPMTLLRKESYHIIQRLRNENIQTELVILEADYKTIHDRILSRGEDEDCWCMENIDLAIAGTISLPGIHISAVDISIENLVRRVFNELNIRVDETTSMKTNDELNFRNV